MKRVLLSFLLLQVCEVSCKVQAFFPVKRKALDMLLDRISEEKKSILFAMFNFTHPEVAQTLLARHKKGVSVTGVIDRSSLFKKDCKGYFLQEKGLDIQVHMGDPRTYMHNKFVIFGNNEVWTGSANWTISGLEETHYENIVVIKNEQDVVERFKKNFYEMYEEFKKDNKKR